MEYRLTSLGLVAAARRRRVIILVALAAAVALIAVPFAGRTTTHSDPDEPANFILARALAVHRGAVQPGKSEMPLSAGVMNALLERELAIQLSGAMGATGALAPVASAPSQGPPVRRGALGCSNVFHGGDGSERGVTNVRVNQDCTLRRQAEEVLAVNPTNFANIIAGQNDSRIGFNHCGYDWSLSGGRTWGDTGTSPPPFWQFLLLDGHTADACSDPAATFDHQGNAYVTGIIFQAGPSPANAIVVAKSNAHNMGTFYHSPAAVLFQEYTTLPLGAPANDNTRQIFHDKELMVADSRGSSPKKGRVYVTWTRFEADAMGRPTRSPIVFSQSLDGGATWSRAIIISGSGPFCTFDSGTPGNPNACDQDQGSHPVVGPDGTLYVIFGNGNTPGVGVNQVLVVRCPVGFNCDREADWQGPFRIDELIGLHPIGNPGNAGGCPDGRRCLPPNGYRAPEFTSMSISVDRHSNLYATWADHRNSGPNCSGERLAWSTATPPCDHDVFYAFSTNRGTDWSAPLNVTEAFGETAQWQPWSDVTGDGSQVKVAFYDRQYGDCEFSGCNDITLATISNPRSERPRISHQRITTSSMPNLIPATNPIQAGFLGDYMWVEVSRHNFDQPDTHIVWADTRPLFGSAPEEDVYYARVRSRNTRGDGGEEDLLAR